MTTFREYLCKRYILEKAFAIQTPQPNMPWEQLSALDKSVFSFSPPLIHVPELDVLKEHFDVILAKTNGMTFSATFIHTGMLEREGLASLSGKLKLAAKNCSKYCGTLQGNKMPVTFEIVLIHDGVPTQEQLDGIKVLRSRETTVQMWCGIVDPKSRRYWTNMNPIAHRFAGYLGRWARDQDISDLELISQVNESGVRFFQIIVGVIVAVALAYGGRYGLAAMGAEHPRLFGGMDLIAGIVGVFIAAIARQVRRDSLAQAGITAGLYSLVLYGSLAAMGATWYGAMAVSTVIIVILGIMIGAVCENF